MTAVHTGEVPARSGQGHFFLVPDGGAAPHVVCLRPQVATAPATCASEQLKCGWCGQGTGLCISFNFNDFRLASDSVVLGTDNPDVSLCVLLTSSQC